MKYRLRDPFARETLPWPDTMIPLETRKSNLWVETLGKIRSESKPMIDASSVRKRRAVWGEYLSVTARPSRYTSRAGARAGVVRRLISILTWTRVISRIGGPVACHGGRESDTTPFEPSPVQPFGARCRTYLQIAFPSIGFDPTPAGDKRGRVPETDEPRLFD